MLNKRNRLIDRSSCKTSVLQEQPLKIARFTARRARNCTASAKLTEFCKRLGIMGIILFLINTSPMLFGQDAETELFQGFWYGVPLSVLEKTLMANRHILVNAYEFSGDTFSYFIIDGSDYEILTNPDILLEGKFTINSAQKTISFTHINYEATLKYTFLDDKKTLRLKSEGIYSRFYFLYR